MTVAAVIGSPVAHSLSPALHRAAFAAAGLDWDYVAFDVPAGSGAAAVDDAHVRAGRAVRDDAAEGRGGSGRRRVGACCGGVGVGQHRRP